MSTLRYSFDSAINTSVRVGCPAIGPDFDSERKITRMCYLDPINLMPKWEVLPTEIILTTCTSQAPPTNPNQFGPLIYK